MADALRMAMSAKEDHDTLREMRQVEARESLW